MDTRDAVSGTKKQQKDERAPRGELFFGVQINLDKCRETVIIIYYFLILGEVTLEEETVERSFF